MFPLVLERIGSPLRKKTSFRKPIIYLGIGVGVVSTAIYCRNANRFPHVNRGMSMPSASLRRGIALESLSDRMGSNWMASDRVGLAWVPHCILRRSSPAHLRPIHYQLGIAISRSHLDEPILTHFLSATVTVAWRTATGSETTTLILKNSVSAVCLFVLDRKWFFGSPNPKPIRTCAESDFRVYYLLVPRNPRGLCNRRLPPGSAYLANYANNKFWFSVAAVEGVTKWDLCHIKPETLWSDRQLLGEDV